MKPIYWILIVIGVLAVSGGGVLFFLNKKKKEQKQKDETDEKKEDKKQKPVQKADPSVLQLQVRLNALLPVGTVLPNGLPKLIEDGIYGKNTAYAQNLVESLHKQGKLPEKIKIKTDTGIAETTSNAMVNTVASIGEFVIKTNPAYVAIKSAGVLWDKLTS